MTYTNFGIKQFRKRQFDNQQCASISRYADGHSDSEKDGTRMTPCTGRQVPRGMAEGRDTNANDPMHWGRA
jgi:hypothetical protein